MITPSDLAYRQTKQIKVSGAPLLSPYRELAEWINARYGVHVLNIILDTIEPDSRPRLNVILEWAEDQRKFLQKELPNFDKDAQLSVQQQFASLKGTLGDQSIHVSRLLVIFSAFEPVARAEANNHITTHEIATLKSTIGNKELWEIRKCFDTVTFFYHTNSSGTFRGAALSSGWTPKKTSIRITRAIGSTTTRITNLWCTCYDGSDLHSRINQMRCRRAKPENIGLPRTGRDRPQRVDCGRKHQSTVETHLSFPHRSVYAFELARSRLRAPRPRRGF